METKRRLFVNQLRRSSPVVSGRPLIVLSVAHFAYLPIIITISLSLVLYLSLSLLPESTIWAFSDCSPARYVLVEGCDYKHESEEEAKKSMFSVSTKYYYAFGCRIHETFTYKIRSLPEIKWVLPDSYIVDGESGYGGEPFVDGEVVAYDEKYHADWLRDQTDEDAEIRVVTKKPMRKRNKKLRSSSVTNMNSWKESKCYKHNMTLSIQFLEKIF